MAALLASARVSLRHPTALVHELPTKWLSASLPPSTAASADCAQRLGSRRLHACALLCRSRAHRTKRKHPKYTATATGLQYLDEVVGSGDAPESGSKVTVHYVGTLQGGKVFDSSHGRGPFSFNIGKGQVIEGWDEGIAGMRVGGIRKLIIPPDLGYGSRGAGREIPPNATLLFECELLDCGPPELGLIASLRKIFSST